MLNYITYIYNSFVDSSILYIGIFFLHAQIIGSADMCMCVCVEPMRMLLIHSFIQFYYLKNEEEKKKKITPNIYDILSLLLSIGYASRKKNESILT